MNMSMGLSLMQSMEVCCDDTVFPKTHAKLNENEYQKALKYLRGFGISEKRYRCVLDCLFTSVFPEWKPHCFQYYEDGEYNLGRCRNEGLILAEELDMYDVIMCDLILEIAVRIHRSKERISWSMFASNVNEVCHEL